MSSTDDEYDPSFTALSAGLGRRIDDAFDSVVLPRTHLKLTKFDVAPGGFIVEEPEAGSASAAGGFIVEGQPVQSFILLSEIPRALRLLDLDPDDEIMDVFKKAATGWGAQNSHSDGVSKKDWRAVCAALLEGELDDGENPAGDEDVEMGADSGPDSDEHHIEGSSSDTNPEESSSDEYEQPTRTAIKAKKAPKAAQRSGTDTSMQLTEAQKAQCRQNFARFFPHIPDSELDGQRIMIKDITRVADLLKESLKTEEVMYTVLDVQ
ncbi:hypothetical protein JVU11DRAFT_4897 [Chiua virens]|nr:hypothetical protein JVU11DRAFT_4897 [Chiua virens]